jgi:hypothetical protein
MKQQNFALQRPGMGLRIKTICNLDFLYLLKYKHIKLQIQSVGINFNTKPMYLQAVPI